MHSLFPRPHKLTFPQCQCTVCCFSSFNAERQTGDAIFQMKEIRQGSLPKATYHFMEELESQFLPFEFPGCSLATKSLSIFHCTAAKQALSNNNWFFWLKGRAQSDSREFVSTYQWILLFLWSITYTHFFKDSIPVLVLHEAFLSTLMVSLFSVSRLFFLGKSSCYLQVLYIKEQQYLSWVS